ncbi:MAG: hypothetical protein H8E66_24275 [Planctomycetes bacterium]|nr:hypothetical protein [Planctomycetota bacterium]
MATIEAVQKACWNHSKSEWTKGFGPLGLSQLGEAEQAREALLKISRGYKGGLPITAVKSGAARLVDSDLERAGEAATALQLLFSSLGEAGSEVWSGYGRTASLKLDELHSTIQAMVEDPWFGSGEGGKIRRERAYLELKSEALLLRFREELGREDVACTEVAATASQVLYLTDSVRKPLILIEKLEDLLIGRLTACTEGSRMPPPPEVQRVIEAATEIRHLLMGHGAGNRCALHIARLLDQRAVRNWNRSPRMPKPDIQLRILRDAMQAVELAPHNPDIVENLASLVLQIDTGSAAEQESRLKTAKQAVDRAIRSVGSNDELEEVQMRLLEQLDPQEARRETQRRLYEARQSAGK